MLCKISDSGMQSYNIRICVRLMLFIIATSKSIMYKCNFTLGYSYLETNSRFFPEAIGMSYISSLIFISFNSYSVENVYFVKGFLFIQFIDYFMLRLNCQSHNYIKTAAITKNLNVKRGK